MVSPKYVRRMPSNTNLLGVTPEDKNAIQRFDFESNLIVTKCRISLQIFQHLRQYNPDKVMMVEVI